MAGIWFWFWFGLIPIRFWFELFHASESRYIKHKIHSKIIQNITQSHKEPKPIFTLRSIKNRKRTKSCMQRIIYKLLAKSPLRVHTRARACANINALDSSLFFATDALALASAESAARVSAVISAARRLRVVIDEGPLIFSFFSNFCAYYIQSGLERW